jgi:hypothetical protein
MIASQAAAAAARFRSIASPARATSPARTPSHAVPARERERVDLLRRTFSSCLVSVKDSRRLTSSIYVSVAAVAPEISPSRALASGISDLEDPTSKQRCYMHIDTRSLLH